jgi:hypothetical protein
MVRRNTRPLTMAVLGQSRHSDRGPPTSGLPRTADIIRASRNVSNVPTTDMCSAVKSVVAVGTCVSTHAPRTEPYVRLSRIRLPPRVCDGKAIAWPRMKDDRFGKPEVCQVRHPRPSNPILLAAPP